MLPNPSDGDFRIAPVTNGAAIIQLVDFSGRVVFTEQAVLIPGTLHALPYAGQLPAGSYVLRLGTASGSSTQLVVEKVPHRSEERRPGDPVAFLLVGVPHTTAGCMAHAEKHHSVKPEVA